MEHSSSWEENWPLIHTETGNDDVGFLRDLLQQPDFSSQGTDIQSIQHPPPPNVHNNFTASLAATTTVAATGGGSISSDETERPAWKSSWPHHRPSSSKSLRTFILSFDNSTIIPATPEQPPHLGAFHQLGGITTRSSSSSSSKSSSSPALSSKKRALLDGNSNNNNDQNLEPKPSRGPSSQGGKKKSRNDSQTLDHIMAERKRRQELNERFIALSATIPGLKKTDKATILREAINYMKQLQERVRELEMRNKRSGREQDQSSTILLLKKSEIESTIIETRDDDDGWCRGSSSSIRELMVVRPDVEARVLELEKEVLIEIQCEKSNGIDLKILDHLHSLHLTVTASSAFPFGNSTLGITIIAQMGEAYRMTVNELVRNLREVLLLMMNRTSVSNNNNKKVMGRRS